MREQFERWLTKGVVGHYHQFLIRRLGGGPNYWYPHIQSAWLAWQHQQKEIGRLTAANKELNSKLDKLSPCVEVKK